MELLLTWHGELDAATFGQCEVGQTLQLAVRLRVDVEVAQMSLLLEVALPAMRLVVLQAIRGGDDFGSYRNEHLLVEGYAKELAGYLRHLAGCVQQNLRGDINEFELQSLPSALLTLKPCTGPRHKSSKSSSTPPMNRYSPALAPGPSTRFG